MEAWIRQKHPRLVMDATHPYAALVTENIRQVCGDNHIPLLRVLRAETPQDEKNGEEAESTVTVETVKEAVDFLAGREGNILVTTGSKELGAFTALEDYRERVYARVLPTSSVLAACEEKGFPGSHIFALQGPFSAEMNVAMLRMASASWLVTKEAGKAGGFEEKLEAAKAARGRRGRGGPAGPDGRSQPGAGSGDSGRDGSPGSRSVPPSSCAGGSRHGNGGHHDGGDSEGSAGQSGCLWRPPPAGGAKEVFARFGGGRQPEMVGEYLPGPVLQWLEAHPDCRRAAVLFSGDTGFYSGTAGFLREAGKKREWEIRILPGISSLSRMASDSRKKLEDAAIASRHGRQQDVRALAENHKKVFVLTGGDCRAEQICGSWKAFR